ncbi:MAG: DUF1289 domain-containing protein, partial [Planctomycetota bacterium]
MSTIPSNKPVASVPSPCMDVCRLDATSDVCLGCFRTLSEIAGWSVLDDDQRTRVLRRIPSRRAMHRAPRQPAN